MGVGAGGLRPQGAFRTRRIGPRVEITPVRSPRERIGHIVRDSDEQEGMREGERGLEAGGNAPLHLLQKSPPKPIILLRPHSPRESNVPPLWSLTFRLRMLTYVLSRRIFRPFPYGPGHRGSDSNIKLGTCVPIRKSADGQSVGGGVRELFPSTNHPRTEKCREKCR